MKKIAALVAAVAMMATSAASMGCIWFMADEPCAKELNLEEV